MDPQKPKPNGGDQKKKMILFLVPPEHPYARGMPYGHRHHHGDAYAYPVGAEGGAYYGGNDARGRDNEGRADGHPVGHEGAYGNGRGRGGYEGRQYAHARPRYVYVQPPHHGRHEHERHRRDDYHEHYADHYANGTAPAAEAAAGQQYSPHYGRRGHCGHTRCMVFPQMLLQMIAMLQQMQIAYATAPPEKQKKFPKPVKTFLQESEQMTDYLKTFADPSAGGKAEPDLEKQRQTAVKFKSVLEEFTSHVAKDKSMTATVTGEMKDFVQEAKETVAFLEEVSNGAEVEIQDNSEMDEAAIAKKYGGQVLPVGAMSNPIASDFPSNNDSLKLSTKLSNNLNSETDTLTPKENTSSVTSSKLDTEMKQLKLEYEAKMKDLEEKHKKMLEEKNRMIQQAYDELDSKHQSRKLSSSKTGKSALDSTSALEKELKQKDDLIKKLRGELESLSERVKKEDVSSSTAAVVKTTPLTVVGDYDNLRCTEWEELRKQMDISMKKWPEMERLLFMCNILKQAEEVARDNYKKISMEIFKKLKKGSSKPDEKALDMKTIMYTVTTVTQANSGKLSSSKSKRHDESMDNVPEGLKKAVEDYFQMSADKANISGIVQDVLHAVSMSDIGGSDIWESRKNSKARELLELYVKACARIAWKMAIQNPQMEFDTTTGVGMPWEQDKSSDLHLYLGYQEDNKDAKYKVEFYVHPALKYNNEIVSKGTVVLEQMT